MGSYTSTDENQRIADSYKISPLLSFHIKLDNLNMDVINLIAKYFDFATQKNLMLTSIYFSKFKITNLFDLRYPEKITNEILRHYSSISKLNAYNNSMITNVSKLMNLTTLYAHGYNCGIVNISMLTNLTELNIGNNNRILGITNLTNMQILHADGECLVNNDIMLKLTNLTYLNVNDNPNVDNINCLKKLQILYANGKSDIKKIDYLPNLTKLSFSGNNKLTNFNHLVHLRTLISVDNPSINNLSIKSLTNLTKLDIEYNSVVNDVSSLTNLTELNCSKKMDISSLKKLIYFNNDYYGTKTRVFFRYEDFNICKQNQVSNIVTPM